MIKEGLNIQALFRYNILFLQLTLINLCHHLLILVFQLKQILFALINHRNFHKEFYHVDLSTCKGLFRLPDIPAWKLARRELRDKAVLMKTLPAKSHSLSENLYSWIVPWLSSPYFGSRRWGKKSPPQHH